MEFIYNQQTQSQQLEHQIAQLQMVNSDLIKKLEQFVDYSNYQK